MLYRTFLVALAILELTAHARADVVLFKDGRRLTGIAKFEGNKLELRVAEGVLFFNRDLIASVQQSLTPLQVYEKRRAALKPADVGGHYQLGLYCESNGLRPQATEEFQFILRGTRDHAQAREKLGFRKVGGKWLTADEEMSAKGLVKTAQGWVTRLEAKEAAQAVGAARQARRAEWEQKRAHAAIEAANRQATEEMAKRKQEFADEEAARLAKEQTEKAAEEKRKREAEQWGRFTICGKCSRRVAEGEKVCPGCNARMGRY